MIVRVVVGSLAAAWLALAVPVRADDAADLAAAAKAFDAGDYAQALKLSQAMADRGIPAGMRALGVIYLQGRGVPKDEATGASWMIKAAEKGLAPSQHEAGILFQNGIGVPKDAEQAAAWFQKAADQNFGVSWQALGRIATEKKKPKEAEAAFRKASKIGVVGAMLDLAQNLVIQAEGMPSKEAKLAALPEAYQWVQTSLVAIPSGPARDEVHRQRQSLEDLITQQDAVGAPRILAAAKKEGEAYAMKLRTEQTAAQDAAEGKAPAPKTSITPSSAPPPTPKMPPPPANASDPKSG